MSNKIELVDATRERVYDIPNRYGASAEVIYARLRHHGFTPEWDLGVREGGYMKGITIPQSETSQLRLLQESNPAIWGNYPDVKAMFDENKKEMEAASVHRRARMDALTADQLSFVEMLHYQSKHRLPGDEALDVFEKLHELAVQHQRLAQISLSESGLSRAQESVRVEVEKKIITLLQDVPGVLKPKFMYDPRGTTVGVIFDSGAHNSMDGSYKVPLNPERVKEMFHENFQASAAVLGLSDQEQAQDCAGGNADDAGYPESPGSIG